jgi:hypothetical protein
MSAFARAPRRRVDRRDDRRVPLARSRLRSANWARSKRRNYLSSGLSGIARHRWQDLALDTVPGQPLTDRLRHEHLHSNQGDLSFDEGLKGTLVPRRFYGPHYQFRALSQQTLFCYDDGKGASLARIKHHAAFFLHIWATGCAPSINPAGSASGHSVCNALGIDLPVSAAHRARSPAAHGPDGMRPSATARNTTRSRQLVGSWTRMRAMCSKTRAPILITRYRLVKPGIGVARADAGGRLPSLSMMAAVPVAGAGWLRLARSFGDYWRDCLNPATRGQSESASFGCNFWRAASS